MSSVREFAARIAKLERGVTALSASPQLGHSSLDNESVNVYDGDGNAKARVGYQHDGTYTAAELDGPVPPVPSAAGVEGGQASLTVRCDGTYEDDARAPLDFRLFEVYAAQAPFTDRNDAFLLGHFSNEAGGEITVARPVGTWYVGLVTKAETGRRSAVSVLATADVTSVVDPALIDALERALGELEIDLGELAVAFTTSEDAPTVTDGDGKPDGAYWTQIDAAGAQIGRWRWTGAGWVDAPLGEVFIPELGVSKLVADQAGFNVAVVNQMFVDMFTAHKITAEHADLGSFLADTGWVADMRTNILTVGSVPPDALALGQDELLPDPMWERGTVTLPAGGPFAWSTLHRIGEQERTLWIKPTLTEGVRLYLSDSKPATPRERYYLRAGALTTARTNSIVLGLELLAEDGTHVGDLLVSPVLEDALPVEPGDDPPEPPDDPLEYPVGELFNIEGVVRVPAGAFRVRPWIGLLPGALPGSADWYIPQCSWRSVPSATNSEGWTSQLTPNGLEVLTPEGGDSVRLGNFEERGLTLYQDEPLVDDDGDPILDDGGEQQSASVATASITDVGALTGREIVASDSLTYRGDELADLLDMEERSRGIVASGSFMATRATYQNLVGIGWVHFMAKPGRGYVVFLNGDVRNQDGTGVTINLHANNGTGGDYKTANVDDPIIALQRITSNKESDNWKMTGVVVARHWIDEGDEEVPVTFGISMQALDGENARLSWFGGDMTVWDGGPNYDSESGYSLLGTSGAPPAGYTAPPPPPPTPAPKKTYRKTFGYSWHRTFQANGAYPRPAQDAAYQGRTPYYTSAGIYRSMVGIKPMTGVLSGADILSARVRVRLAHSHSNTGGVVVVRMHGVSGRPSSFTGGLEVGRVKLRRGKEYWMTIPKKFHAGIKSGTYRGISFYVNSTSTAYYVQMTPGRTAIQVEYRK